jgi:hypothetical protein
MTVLVALTVTDREGFFKLVREGSAAICVQGCASMSRLISLVWPGVIRALGASFGSVMNTHAAFPGNQMSEERCGRGRAWLRDEGGGHVIRVAQQPRRI